ncbi:hypothetical protein ACU81Q_14660 [Komagataeibacter melomenusus]
MGKKDDFWLNPQSRRAQCLEMAIRHADAVGVHYDADDIIEHADAFGDYILTGEVAAVDDEPAAAADVGVLNARIIGGGFRVPEAMLRPATAAKPPYDADGEKRKVEEVLAKAAMVGLKVRRIITENGFLGVRWDLPCTANPLDMVALQIVCDDIAREMGKLHRNGWLCAVHYDGKDFPCVSWHPATDAAA